MDAQSLGKLVAQMLDARDEIAKAHVTDITETTAVLRVETQGGHAYAISVDEVSDR